MTSLLRLLLAALAALLLGLMAAPGPAAAVPETPAHAYTYDPSVHIAPSVDVARERGPPATSNSASLQAVRLGSYGASARQDGPTPRVGVTYDDTAGLVPVAQPTGTAGEQAQGDDGFLTSLAPTGVAAKTAARACSFTGATVVLMADGTKKPIEDVKVGDKVLATDPETGEQVAKKVEHVFVHDDTVIDLVVDGEVISTTEDHPFWSVTDRKFERADELSPGEQVLGADGRLVTVSGLKLGSARAAFAYNLTVEGIHTYHVGDAEILVHNACPITGLRNGDALPTSQALDKAEHFLGNGYSEVGNGRFLSADGLRQVRMTDADIAPRCGERPHLNFETWVSPVTAGGRNKTSSNLHIYLPEEFP